MLSAQRLRFKACPHAQHSCLISTPPPPPPFPPPFSPGIVLSVSGVFSSSAVECVRTDVVQKKDTCATFAQRNGISTDQLQEYNPGLSCTTSYGVSGGVPHLRHLTKVTSARDQQAAALHAKNSIWFGFRVWRRMRWRRVLRRI